MKKIRMIFLTLVFMGLVSVSVILTILNVYIPAYRVTVGEQEIGYFRTKQDFDETFYILSKEMNDSSGANFTYLESEPIFDKIYVKYQRINTDLNYTTLKSQLKNEYEIYNVYINDEKKFTFESYEEAEKYSNEIKKQKGAPNVKIESAKIKDKTDEIDTKERANAKLKQIVSRYKPVEEVKPVVKKPVVKKATTTYRAGSTATISNSTVYTQSASGGSWPTTSRRISCGYGGYYGHTGIDIDGDTGDPNMAYKAGKVVFAGYAGSYGYLVKIDHGNGIQSWYAHNSRLLVSLGQEVQQGQTIALQGSTGNSTGSHLHFEIRINGRATNPRNYI